MGVYGLPWTNLSHRYRYRGTCGTFRYFFDFFGIFNPYNMGVLTILISAQWIKLELYQALWKMFEFCNKYTNHKLLQLEGFF